MDNTLLSFNDVNFDDERPLPVIVAQQWGFSLTTVSEDGKYWYSIRDWLSGLTGTKFPKHTWADLRKSPELQLDFERVREFRYGKRGGYSWAGMGMLIAVACGVILLGCFNGWMGRIVGYLFAD